MAEVIDRKVTNNKTDGKGDKSATPVASGVKKGKRQPKTDEQKEADRVAGHAKFLELVAARTERMERYVRLIGNLGRRSQYHYTDAERDAIIDWTAKMVGIIRNGFADSASAKKSMGLVLGK